LFHKDFTSPITVWYHQSKFAITQIKWCLLYFDDEQLQDEESKIAFKGAQNFGDAKARFAARICEFFAIDQSEDFQIWNLTKSTHKPAHVIKFKDKHKSDENYKMYRISTTCPDQSFFTAFALADHSVSMYFMNFKKGSSITQKKLLAENKKSLKIISTLPSNLMSQMENEIGY